MSLVSSIYKYTNTINNYKVSIYKLLQVYSKLYIMHLSKCHTVYTIIIYDYYTSKNQPSILFANMLAMLSLNVLKSLSSDSNLVQKRKLKAKVNRYLTNSV